MIFFTLGSFTSTYSNILMHNNNNVFILFYKGEG